MGLEAKATSQSIDLHVGSHFPSVLPQVWAHGAKLVSFLRFYEQLVVLPFSVSFAFTLKVNIYLSYIFACDEPSLAYTWIFLSSCVKQNAKSEIYGKYNPEEDTVSFLKSLTLS